MSSPLDEMLKDLQAKVYGLPGALTVAGSLVKPGEEQLRLREFVYERHFLHREGQKPRASRASGDSGWVAHLSSLAHGVTGWEGGFKLLKVAKNGEEDGPRGPWAFASDGRICLFLDEPGQYLPPEAREGETVSVRIPRSRENLYPHRFTLLGGRGAAATTEPLVKLYATPTVEGAAALVSHLSGRAGEHLRFTLIVTNDPRDFLRSDAICLDVGRHDEDEASRMLSEFLRAHPHFVRPASPPMLTRTLRPGLARADALERGDAGEGYGLRVSDRLAEAVLTALAAGEKTVAAWKVRLQRLR